MGRCGIVVGRCGLLWVVVDRCGSFRVLVTTRQQYIEGHLKNGLTVTVEFDLH